jgi:hypothetical protein
MQNQQIANLLESLKQNSGMNIVFTKFVNDFFKHNYELEFQRYEHDAIHETSYDELEVMAYGLSAMWHTVYGHMSTKVCENGLTYLVNRGYPKEFCEWFAEHITHNYANDDFVNQLNMDVIPKFYNNDVMLLACKSENIERSNKIFNIIDNKIGMVSY